MRILLIYKRAPWIERHVITSFRTLNAKLECLDLRGGDARRQDESPTNSMRGRILSGDGFDLIFMVEGTDESVDLDALSRARRNGTIICNFLVDVPQEWWRSKDVARVCNVVLVAQKENALRLKRATNEIVYFPFAVSDEFLREAYSAVEDEFVEENRDGAIFMGSAHSRWRWQFLARLDKAGIPLDVVGNGWLAESNEADVRGHIARLLRLSAGHHFERMRGTGGLSAVIGGVVNQFAPIPQIPFKNVRFHGFLDDAALKVILRKAAVNVSTSVHGSGYLVGRPKRQFKLRDIELPCYDVPLLTDPAPELKEIFENEKHVLFYDSWQELVALTRRACRFPDQYRDLSSAARTLVKRDHTWTSRFRELNNIINMNIAVP